MKTLLLLILPLSISISAFGQIKKSSPKASRTLKNAPVTNHRPAVREPKPASHSSSISSPNRSRPSSSSSGSSTSSQSSSNTNHYYTTSTNRNRSNNNNTNYQNNSTSTNENGQYQILEGYNNIALPTSGEFVRTLRVNLVKTIVEQIDSHATDSTDIVILIDASGSMGNNIKTMMKESDAILASVPAGSRVGAASFRISSSNQWFVLSDLSEDHWNAIDFIGKKRGYHSSESHYDAIVKTVNSSTWKNNKRMIITITDEYIAPVENTNSAEDAIEAAASENVELHTILIAF
ncbi:VWA domain-containing protein [Crocinitomicaceae bacterium]|nr:VWA domain-containing protein [Crocinitomicaceae bacterium]